MASITRADIDRLTKELVDKGQIIEAGWVSLRLMALPPDTCKVQIDEMRNAFFAGAQHLFASLMSSLEEDAEPTEADLRRMDLIEEELEGFIKEYELRHAQAEGRS